MKPNPISTPPVGRLVRRFAPSPWKRLLGTSAALALVSSSAPAASLVWDPLHNTVGSDGAGTWSTSAANWANGASDSAWSNLGGDTAVFGASGTGNSVTVSGLVTIGGIIFNLITGNYAISGGTISVGAAATITTVSDATISSKLTGTSAVLTKDGAGTLTLNSTTNTGISTINVTAGTLATATSGSSSFGNSSTALVVSTDAAIRVAAGSVIQNAITFNGGTGAVAYIGGATLSGPITLASGDTKINTSDVATISGAIGGTGSLTLNGPNKLTLTGVNTYSGGTNIVDGVLQVAAGGTLGTGAVTNATNLELNTSAGDIAIANAISGGGSVTKSGPGIGTLSGSVTSTGYTIISGGTLLVNGTKNGGSAALVYVAGAGSVLGGTGTIVGASAGAVTLLAGGAVSPGLPNTMGTWSWCRMVAARTRTIRSTSVMVLPLRWMRPSGPRRPGIRRRT